MGFLFALNRKLICVLMRKLESLAVRAGKGLDIILLSR